MIYKIRRKKDGWFSLGGNPPRFGKTGKVWKRKSDLSCHIGIQSSRHINQYDDNCEIVIYETIETSTQSIKTFYEIL